MVLWLQVGAPVVDAGIRVITGDENLTLETSRHVHSHATTERTTRPSSQHTLRRLLGTDDCAAPALTAHLHALGREARLRQQRLTRR